MCPSNSSTTHPLMTHHSKSSACLASPTEFQTLLAAICNLTTSCVLESFQKLNLFRFEVPHCHVLTFPTAPAVQKFRRTFRFLDAAAVIFIDIFIAVTKNGSRCCSRGSLVGNSRTLHPHQIQPKQRGCLLVKEPVIFSYRIVFLNLDRSL